MARIVECQTLQGFEMTVFMAGSQAIGRMTPQKRAGLS